MELSKLFLLGFTGYLLAGLYDIALMYKKTLISRILYLGFFVTALPYIVLFVMYSSAHSSSITIVLIIGMLCFLILLIYSVLLEIPLKNNQDGSLYRKGTYSICRHPGFLWHAACSILAAIYFWHTPITMMMFGFIICNFILILIEDMILFPRMFDTYETYKKTTPFLIPH